MLACLCSLYSHGDGTVTFIDILRAFKVAGVQRQGGASGGGVGSGSSGGIVSLKDYEWHLSEVQDAQGRHYLLDDETKVWGVEQYTCMLRM